MPRKAADEAAKKPAKWPAPSELPRDDGENAAVMEPMRISEENPARAELTQLVLDLTKHSTALRSNLPMGLTEPLADFRRRRKLRPGAAFGCRVAGSRHDLVDHRAG